MRATRAWLGTLLSIAVLANASPAWAFPGLVLAKDGAPRAVRGTTVVLMQHAGYSVVTLMADVEGPLRPFALLVPVPGDVTLTRLRTVRRSTIARVESISAPRLHAFYEQDPCDDAPVQQSWDEHIKATGRGFLTPDGVPPGDKHYAVSNAISMPVAPVFKERESEFSYRILGARAPEGVRAELEQSGYSLSPAALDALGPVLGAGAKLLVAEVSLAHVELGTDSRLRLGGIRYFTRGSATTLRESLGRGGTNEGEDLFVYVFDRQSRYAVRDAPSASLPSNVVVEARAAERLAGVYAAFFGVALEKSPGAVALEYAWSTSGCGEPCPDVPLGADELMTLGGDVLESNTTTAVERAPDPGPERERDRERFEQHLAELMPAERPKVRREHAADRKEIARRRALAARQTYVLTRLHQSRPGSVPPRDLELVPAPPESGGIGVPEGRAGEFRRAGPPAAENKFQIRFVALNAWSRGVACASPRRGAWGKRWASEARQSRAVPLALDLGPARADRGLLSGLLVRPVPELGLRERPAAEAASVAAPAGVPSATAPPSSRRGCGVAPASRGRHSAAVVLALLAGLTARRRRHATCIRSRRCS